MNDIAVECSVESCCKPASARGWCRTHYERWRRGARAKRFCSIAGCEKDVCAKGWCSAHYTRWKRHGDPCAPLKRHRQSGTCSVSGCEQPARTTGYCAAHKAQQTRTGNKPTPFKYKWATEKCCIVCGKAHDHPRLRKFCSARCVQRARRPRENNERSSPCLLCGASIDMHLAAVRKRRADIKMCDTCRRSRSLHHKTSVRVLAARDGTTCGICGENVDLELKHPNLLSPSVDHVVPRACGGSNDPLNLQLAHLTCNLRKQARMPERGAV